MRGRGAAHLRVPLAVIPGAVLADCRPGQPRGGPAERVARLDLVERASEGGSRDGSLRRHGRPQCRGGSMEMSGRPWLSPRRPLEWRHAAEERRTCDLVHDRDPCSSCDRRGISESTCGRTRTLPVRRSAKGDLRAHLVVPEGGDRRVDGMGKQGPSRLSPGARRPCVAAASGQALRDRTCCTQRCSEGGRFRSGSGSQMDTRPAPSTTRTQSGSEPAPQNVPATPTIAPRRSRLGISVGVTRAAWRLRAGSSRSMSLVSQKAVPAPTAMPPASAPMSARSSASSSASAQ